MNALQHCTRDTERKTLNSQWPLRGADGLTWAERKERKERETR